MKKSVNQASGGWSIFLSILLYFGILLTLLGNSFERTFFSTKFYTEILKESNFYDQLPSLVVDETFKATANSTGLNFINFFTHDQVETMIRSVLPAGWVEAQVTSTIAATLDFLNFKSGVPENQINLQPIKENLTGEVGKQALMSMVSSLPGCTEEQINTILQSMQTGQIDIPVCKPPEEFLPFLEIFLDPLLANIAATIPDTVQFPSAEQTQVMQNLTQTVQFRIYKTIRKSFALTPWLSLALAVAIFIVSIRSLKQMTNSLGFPLALAGLTAALPAAWILWQSGANFNTMISRLGLPWLTSTTNSVFIDILQIAMLSFGRLLLIWSLGALLAGLILIAIHSMCNK